MNVFDFFIGITGVCVVIIFFNTFVYFSLKKGVIMNLRHKIVKMILKYLTPRIYKELDIYELFDESNPFLKEKREIKHPRPMIKFIKENLNTKKLKGVEIGVQKGYNAKSIFSNLNIEKLYLIDIWEINPNYLYEVITRLNDNFRVKTIQENSFTAHRHFKNEALDFIYIDGDHTYNGALSDIENFYPKVRKGGVFGGHDYNLLYVKKAVDNWVKQERKVLNTGLCYNGKSIDWWVIK